MLLPGFDEGDVTHAHLVFHTVHDEFGPSLQADEHLLAVLVDVTAFGMAIFAGVVEVETAMVESGALHDFGQKVVAPEVFEIEEAAFPHWLTPKSHSTLVS